MSNTVVYLPQMDRPGRHPAASPTRNMICVASGKGGVGKTWLAVSLSHALARQGSSTLLFDGDLGLANVDVQLGLMPDRDLAGVVEGDYRLQDAIVAHAGGGFDVLAGRSGSASLASLESASLLGLRAELLQQATRYDRIVVDLGAGIDSAVRAMVDAAGCTLVVTTDEPTALTDAYAFIKLTNQRRSGTDLRVVVNMAPSHREGERTYAKLLKACEGFLKLSPPLAGVIRRDERVRDAIRHQTSLLTRHPGSEAASDIEALARRLLDSA
ncbi:MAG: MinD/ParA family protein [Alphaproteobacteria bacterium]|nr:MinD/ParA family protein [Alphaproteobacteria bacterium]